MIDYEKEFGKLRLRNNKQNIRLALVIGRDRRSLGAPC